MGTIIQVRKIIGSGGLVYASLGSCLFLVSTGGATDTRVETMGAASLFLENEDNIWYFPATILEYPDLLVLSIGGQPI